MMIMMIKTFFTTKTPQYRKLRRSFALSLIVSFLILIFPIDIVLKASVLIFVAWAVSVIGVLYTEFGVFQPFRKLFRSPPVVAEGIATMFLLLSLILPIVLVDRFLPVVPRVIGGLVVLALFVVALAMVLITVYLSTKEEEP